MSSRIGVTAAMALVGECCTSEASITAQNAGLICQFPWHVIAVPTASRRTSVAEPATAGSSLETRSNRWGQPGRLWARVGMS